MRPSAATSRRCPTGIVILVTVLLAGCGQAATSLVPTPGGSSGPASAPASAAAAGAATGGSALPSPAASRSAAATLPPAAPLDARLAATIDGIVHPCALAATPTDVWITGNGPSILARIDPATNKVTTRTTLAGSPCGIAIGPDGRVWVALLQIGRVVAVDPLTTEVTATIGNLGSSLWDLKAGFGSIWVVDRSKREVLRIDPAAATVAARIPIGRLGSGLAVAGDAVWVVDESDSTVRRIDPATNEGETVATLRRGSVWFSNDDERLLVSNRFDGSITPIDSAGGGAGPPIEGAISPLDGTVLGGRAYVPDSKGGTLLEIDPAAGRVTAVDRLDGAKTPFVAEAALGDVWVLDYGGQRIWRITP